jgi:hypothetical protein
LIDWDFTLSGFLSTYSAIRRKAGFRYGRDQRIRAITLSGGAPPSFVRAAFCGLFIDLLGRPSVAAFAPRGGFLAAATTIALSPLPAAPVVSEGAAQALR